MKSYHTITLALSKGKWNPRAKEGRLYEGIKQDYVRAMWSSKEIFSTVHLVEIRYIRIPKN